MINTNLYEEAPEWMFRKEPVNKDCILIKRVEDIGEAKQLLSKIHKHELFEDIGKYSETWKNEDSKVDDILDGTRRKLCNLQYLLEELSEVLEREYDDH